MLRPAAPSAEIIVINSSACGSALTCRTLYSTSCFHRCRSLAQASSFRPVPMSVITEPSASSLPTYSLASDSPLVPREGVHLVVVAQNYDAQHGSSVSVIIDHAFQVFVDSRDISILGVARFCRLFS